MSTVVKTWAEVQALLDRPDHRFIEVTKLGDCGRHWKCEHCAFRFVLYPELS